MIQGRNQNLFTLWGQAEASGGQANCKNVSMYKGKIFLKIC